MPTLPFRFPLIGALLAMALVSSSAIAASKGIIIYKDPPYVADEFAETVEYNELEEFTNIFHLTTAQGEKRSILTANIVKHIPYLDRQNLPEVIEPKELARVTSAISDLSAAGRRYPKSAKLLDPHIRQLQEIVDRFNKGEALLNGVWLPSKEAALKIKKDREAAIAAADAEELRQQEARRLEREKFAAEVRTRVLEQKDRQEKEIIRKQQEAKAAEEKRQLLEASQAEEARRQEEQQRTAAEKQALEAQRIEYASRKMREADRFTEELDLPVSLATAP